MLKNDIIDNIILFEYVKKFTLKCNLTKFQFFCHPPDNFQSETELSYWTMQRNWIKNLAFKRIGQNKTGLIELLHYQHA